MFSQKKTSEQSYEIANSQNMKQIIHRYIIHHEKLYNGHNYQANIKRTGLNRV